MTAPVDLRTERLLLRSFRRSDIPQIVRLAGAREVAVTTLRIPHPYTENDADYFLSTFETECRRGSAAVFAVTLNEGVELCGAVGLHIESAYARAELGFWIGVPYWGRGYATEAARAVMKYGFESLKLHRIYASHFKDNLASKRVLLKLAMRYEGCARHHIQKWGRFIDLENYGLLAEEYRP